MRATLAVLIVGCLLVATPADTSEGAPPPVAAPKLFGTREIRSANFQPFVKWTGMLERYSKEAAAQNPGGCDAKKFTKCHYDAWMKFLGGLKGKDQKTQVTEVNRYMNEAKYITDPINWGVEDYWATPGEFLAKFGDCEDYAIAKYASLKLLGFPEDQMRVVAVKDLNLKIGHAILAVYLDGKILILDNQIKQVADADGIKHYEPVFSINEKFWWRHGK
jgi:predicted transglutaminase-like cysteine proteinase